MQTDPEPRVPPQAVQKSAVDAGSRYIVQPWEDDLYVSPNGDRIHLKPNCHGLRNAVRTVRNQYASIVYTTGAIIQPMVEAHPEGFMG